MKLNNFPELLTLTDNDYLLGWDAANEITVKVKASTIKTYINTVTTPSLPNLVFESFGDNKGISFWLATRDGSNWSNPHTTSKLEVIVSGVGAGSAANITDRSSTVSNYTTNANNSYWGIDFKTHKLKPTYYTIRHDANNGYALRSWKLQGSNNGTDWTDLDVQTNNTALNSAFSWVGVAVTVSTSYRYLRILMTNVNSSGSYEFCCGELEFYGQVETL